VRSLDHGDGGCADPGADVGQIITSVPAFLALEQEWRDLCHRAPEHYFTQSFDWCRVSWEKVAEPRGRRLYCLVLRQDGRAVLIWPLVTYRNKFWSIARPLGPETTEYTAPLVEDGPHSAQWIAKAWRMVRKSCAGDVVLLPYVRADSPLHRVICRDKAAIAPSIAKTFFVTWGGHPDWDSYYRTLDRHQRREVDRPRRRLSDLGELKYRPMIEPREFPAVIDWMLARKTDWLLRTGRRGAWRDENEYRKFLVAVSRWTERRPGIGISVLELDAKLVAAVLTRRDNVRLEGVITVFDPALRQFGPDSRAACSSPRKRVAAPAGQCGAVGKAPAGARPLSPRATRLERNGVMQMPRHPYRVIGDRPRVPT
jgi:CelD/BcsL family acetyltransferase involved in cellulose biosynthesis